MYFAVDTADSAVLKIVHNGDLICQADVDQDNSPGDRANVACSGVAQLSEGEFVYVCVCVRGFMLGPCNLQIGVPWPG